MSANITNSNVKSLLSKTYTDIYRQIYLYLNPKKVKNCNDLVEFLHDFSTRSAGGMVLSYAQKRTGKLHFKLAKEKEYADDLIKAQIGTHAEIVSDMWFLSLVYLKLPRKKLQKTGKKIITELHERYVQTSPTDIHIPLALKKRHFEPKEKTIKEFAEKSGKVLFELLPLTENLLEHNVEAFIGQFRSRYIGYFEKLDGRIDRKSLIADMEKRMQ